MPVRSERTDPKVRFADLAINCAVRFAFSIACAKAFSVAAFGCQQSIHSVALALHHGQLRYQKLRMHKLINRVLSRFLQ